MRPSISRLTCLAFAVLASVGCVAAPDAVEPDESVESVASAVVSPSMVINDIKVAKPIVIGSVAQAFVTPVAELYVKVIKLKKGAANETTAGTFTIGSPAAPGTASVTINGPLFDFILAESKVHQLAIKLRYGSGLRIVDVFIEVLPS